MATIGYLFLCVLLAWAASEKYNRNPVGWFLLPLVFSPLLAAIALLIVGEKK